MKIEFTEDYHFVLKEVFNSVILETAEGNKLAICMRDDTFEINVIGKRKDSEQSNWHTVNISDGTIDKF